MSRPKKCRRICDYPQTPSFVPEEMPEKGETVVLSLEEYETIRLIDREGCSVEAHAGGLLPADRSPRSSMAAVSRNEHSRRELADGRDPSRGGHGA